MALCPLSFGMPCRKSSLKLEQDGLIFKTTFPEVPPRVEFELTELGLGLAPALDILEKWGKKHYKENIRK